MIHPITESFLVGCDGWWDSHDHQGRPKRRTKDCWVGVNEYSVYKKILFTETSMVGIELGPSEQMVYT